MKFFSDLLVSKQEGSEFLYYSTDKGKQDAKIHSKILKKPSQELLNMSISRLRVRSGVSIEDAKILLGL